MGSYFFEFGAWWAALVIPVAGICWTVIYGLTGDQGGWLIGTIPMLISLGLLFMNVSGSEPLSLFIASIWLQRTSYLLATKWLEDIVSTSYAAYEMMVEHVSIVTSD